LIQHKCCFKLKPTFPELHEDREDVDTGRLIDFGVFCAGCAVAAIVLYLIHRHRRRRAMNLMRGLFADYFDEKIGVEEVGRKTRAVVGRGFLGGNESFAETVRAFQKAVDKRLPPNHSLKDEAKLLGLLAALKTEFGLTDRYLIEGWRAGRE
jgi:hypothetical protein